MSRVKRVTPDSFLPHPLGSSGGGGGGGGGKGGGEGGGGGICRIYFTQKNVKSGRTKNNLG